MTRPRDYRQAHEPTRLPSDTALVDAGVCAFCVLVLLVVYWLSGAPLMWPVPR